MLQPRQRLGQKHSQVRILPPRNEEKRRGPLGLHRFFEW
ncbi:hypothetical protein Pla163_17630 [Planctomycetes bacterium Pla163]|uniref:Uncharacterized protein n=1 Tax=Rohdeia mirabilis TaxID=2528008 RepID=A0A518CZJ7_9BACT|nr:hypothetical protein Pla163_17630 [Planctomycetes bacterium Pla163]